MNTKGILKEYIINELLMGQFQGQLEDDTSLISSGILDSLSLIRLITFIEDRFKLPIEDEDVIPDNFETIQTIEMLIAGRQS